MSSLKPWFVCLVSFHLGACLATSSYDNADLGKSTLTAPTLNLPGDGVTQVPVTVTLRRASGKAISGVNVQVAVDKCTVTQPSQSTSAAGAATALVQCAQPGQRTVSATVSQAEFHAALGCTLTLNVLDSNAPLGTVPPDAPLNVQVSVPSTDKPYTGTIHFVSSDPDATLPPDYTFTAGDNGVHVLVNAVVLRTPGEQTVQALDRGTGRIVYAQTFWVAAPTGTTSGTSGDASTTGGVTAAGSSSSSSSSGSTTTGGTSGGSSAGGTASDSSTTGGGTASGSSSSSTTAGGASSSSSTTAGGSSSSSSTTGGGSSSSSTTGASLRTCHEVGGGTYVATSTTGPATRRLGDIVLDPNRNPMLVYLNDITATNVYVMVYDGASWVGLASSNSGKGITGRSDGVMMSPAVSTLSNGAPAATWLTQAGDGFYANYMFWSGSAWSYLGSSKQVFNTISYGGDATLAVNSNNVPFVTWEQNSTSLVARQWGGASWNGLATQAQTMATSISPSAGVGGDDAPVLAWVDQTETGTSKIFVAHYASGTWTAFGGSASGGGLGTGTNPVLAMDANERPVVVWDNGNNIYLLAWSGSAWQALGGSASGNGISGNTTSGADRPTLAMDSNNRPVVAWEDAASGQIFLRRFDGTSWVDDGGGSGQGASAASNAAHWPRLRMGATDRPVLYWQESSATTRLHVCAWY